MTEAKKAREFWIAFDDMGENFAFDNEQDAIDCEWVGDDKFGNLKVIRVIEYSALQALIDENAKLVEKLKKAEDVIRFYGNPINWTNSTDALMQQRDKIYFDKDNNGLAGRTARVYLKEQGELK